MEATYLIFHVKPETGRYYKNSAEIWVGDAPEPGVNIPATSMAVPWEVFNNCINPAHYLLVAGDRVVHRPCGQFMPEDWVPLPCEIAPDAPPA